jgi:hypothetical protein
MSSGEVSKRTKIVFTPFFLHSKADWGSKTIFPYAAPGEAPKAFPSDLHFFAASGSI